VISNLKRINAGPEGEVYSGLLDSRKIILKSRSDKNINKLWLEGDVYKELEKIGVLAPKFVSVGEEGLVISFLEGASLKGEDYLYDDARLWKSVSKDLSLLKNIKCVGFGKIKKYENGIFYGEFDSWQESLQETGKNILFGLSDYWRKNIGVAFLGQGNLLHGDFCMDHIWINNGEYAGTIDFGDALIGDPLMDMAYFKFKEINKDYGDSVFNHLYSVYSTIVKDDRKEKERDRLINLYMIYWAINRITSIKDDSIRKSFIDKTKVLLEKL